MKMKKKMKKGFTLIELLAVIVILAVIALIATPLIMNVINNSKKGANKDSAYEYIKAVETAIITDAIKNGGTIDANKYLTEVQSSIIKGTKPDSINLTIDKNGKITGGSITVGGITFVLNDKGELTEGPASPAKTWKEKTGQLYTMTSNATGLFTVTGTGGSTAWKAFDNSTATSVDVNRDESYSGTIMFGKAIKIKEMSFAAAMYTGGGFRAEGGDSEYYNSVYVTGIKADGTKVTRIVTGSSTTTGLFSLTSTNEEEFIGIEVGVSGTSYMSVVSEIQITKWLELE